MPIYDYVCGGCGHRLEVVHGIHGHGPRSCPACGAEGTMSKAFVPPAIHFKGSGWAKKDRSATASPGSAKANSTAASSSPSGEAAAGGDAASTSAPAAGDSATTSQKT